MCSTCTQVLVTCSSPQTGWDGSRGSTAPSFLALLSLEPQGSLVMDAACGKLEPQRSCPHPLPCSCSPGAEHQQPDPC